MSPPSCSAPAGERAIVHLNVADFAVAVERQVDGRLRSRPVIVAGAAARAPVLDMSEEAYREGVRKGMPLGQALRRCPGSCHLPPHPERYARAMRALVARALAFSPLAEPGEGDGHLFLDLSGTSRLFGPPADVAWRLRRQVRAELALDPIWTLGPNKLVAKAASRLVKPSGEYIVGGGEEEAFMAPLPLSLVPGIEAPDQARLAELNLTCAGQVAALSTAQLAVPCGHRADQIHEIVRGVDFSSVRPAGVPAPREEADHVFAAGSNVGAELEAALYALVECVGYRLRRRRLATRRLTVTLDHADGVRRVRQASLQPATANDLNLFPAARTALVLAWSRRVRVRRLCLACDHLVLPPMQLTLFLEERQAAARSEALVGAIDAVRERFGVPALCLGRTLPPLLPRGRF